MTLFIVKRARVYWVYSSPLLSRGEAQASPSFAFILVTVYQCFKNRTDDGTEKVIDSRFRGRIDSQTAVELD